MADAGLGEESELPCLECALWTLLHVFCVEAPRNDGFLSEVSKVMAVITGGILCSSSEHRQGRKQGL